MVKNPPANAGGSRDTGSISGSERSPWYRKWQPAPVFLPIKFHGKRSLAGYNLWGRKELDTKKMIEHTRKHAHNQEAPTNVELGHSSFTSVGKVGFLLVYRLDLLLWN